MISTKTKHQTKPNERRNKIICTNRLQERIILKQASLIIMKSYNNKQYNSDQTQTNNSTKYNRHYNYSIKGKRRTTRHHRQIPKTTRETKTTRN